jgi:hypothetical protein
MVLDRAAIRFLLRTALHQSIFRIPKTIDMQTGHKKRLLDAGVESLASDVTDTILRAGIVWTKPDRER